MPNLRHNLIVLKAALAFSFAANKVKIIQAIEKQAWGQNVFRFYDPENLIP